MYVDAIVCVSFEGDIEEDLKRSQDHLAPGQLSVVSYSGHDCVVDVVLAIWTVMTDMRESVPV